MRNLKKKKVNLHKTETLKTNIISKGEGLGRIN